MPLSNFYDVEEFIRYFININWSLIVAFNIQVVVLERRISGEKQKHLIGIMLTRARLG